MAKRSDHDDRAEAEDEDETRAEGSEEGEEGEEGEKGEKGKASAEEAAPRPRPKARPKRPASRGARPLPAPAVQGGSLGKSLILFLLIIGGMAAGFAILGQETTGGAGPAVKWKVGEKPTVEITLVASDKRDLSCWSPQEINGKHCAFEAPARAWSKGANPNDEKLTFRPYTTTDRIQFLAAGLWSEPALQGTLPIGRFALKCTFTVEGMVKRPNVRWSSEGAWLDQTNDWYAGSVSNCRMVSTSP